MTHVCVVNGGPRGVTGLFTCKYLPKTSLPGSTFFRAFSCPFQFLVIARKSCLSWSQMSPVSLPEDNCPQSRVPRHTKFAFSHGWLSKATGGLRGPGKWEQAIWFYLTEKPAPRRRQVPPFQGTLCMSHNTSPFRKAY